MSKVPDHWADLTEEEREAVIQMARGHIFWQAVFSRFSWLGKAAQIALAIAAAWILFKDGLAQWLQGLGK